MTDKSETLDNSKLMDVVRNYRQYGYDEKLRAKAISLLEDRGVSKEHLKLSGNFTNQSYDFAIQLYGAFSRNSKIAFILYGIVFVSNIFISVVPDRLETLGLLGLFVNIGALLLYFAFLIKSFMNQNEFYSAIKQEYDGALIYVFVGMPFYIFMYFYFRNQMKEKIKEIK